MPSRWAVLICVDWQKKKLNENLNADQRSPTIPFYRLMFGRSYLSRKCGRCSPQHAALCSGLIDSTLARVLREGAARKTAAMLMNEAPARETLI